MKHEKSCHYMGTTTCYAMHKEPDPKDLILSNCINDKVSRRIKFTETGNQTQCEMRRKLQLGKRDLPEAGKCPKVRC